VSVGKCGYQGSQCRHKSEHSVQRVYHEPISVCKRMGIAGKGCRSFERESGSSVSLHQLVHVSIVSEVGLWQAHDRSN
jgi:hypothetical protein